MHYKYEQGEIFCLLRDKVSILHPTKSIFYDERKVLDIGCSNLAACKNGKMYDNMENKSNVRYSIEQKDNVKTKLSKNESPCQQYPRV